MDVLPLEYFVM